MDGKKRIMTIITSMLFTFAVVIVIIVAINFRDYSQKQAFNKAKITAELIRDGLTAHMTSGTMDQRSQFLQNVKHSSSAQDIWIFRSQKVIKQFGAGFNNEVVRDEIDKEVIASGKHKQIITEDMDNATLRITIPYIATAYNTPNCLECHTQAKEGDVLGGITMVFDIQNIRDTGAATLFKIIFISIVLTIGFLYVANRLIAPYFKALIDIEGVFKKADIGDYSIRLDTNTSGETREVAKWLNNLFEKLEGTIGAIEKNISLFVADRKLQYNDPLSKSKAVIEDLADIYKFKKTIEHDKNKDVIYARLVKFFKESLNINDISLYEVDATTDTRKLIYDDTPEKFCDIADKNTSEHCRAYRTNSVIISDEFPNLCQACNTTKEYLCMNHTINDTISLVLNVKPKNKDELHENKKAIGYIRNYLESAKPVLQSKILTDILQESNHKDGLTGLYNRKYLDKFMENITKDKETFGIIMLDIDFFKKVNDTYGHDSGDIAIKTLSNIMQENSYTKDTVFRFGGEEFVIYVDDADKAYDLADKIRIAFSKVVFEFNGDSIQKTLSAGVSIYPQDAKSIWTLIKYADLALYEAKESGRNKIVRFYPELALKN